MRSMNFREPVEYIIRQHEKKRNTHIVVDDDENYKGELPEYPCRLIRNENKKVVKIIYAGNTELEWSEELIRNSEDKVYQIKTTYPDKTEKTIELFKNTDNRVETIDYV